MVSVVEPGEMINGMGQKTVTALVLCPNTPPGEGVERKIAGLTVGERLLLALSFEGVGRVAFIGDGPRPVSSRADIEIFDADSDIPPDEPFWLLTSDTVFDRSMLREGNEPDPDLPLRLLDPPAWKAVVEDPAGWLALTDPGRAKEGSRFAIRITDRAMARAAQRALLLSLIKPVDGFVSRHINRKISLAITKHLVRTGLSPNHLTVFIMILGVASGVFAALAEPWWMLVIAGFLFQAQSVLDGCDGEIARITYRFSYTGQWMDTIGDDLTNWAFTLGLAIGQARMMNLPWLYVAGGYVLVAQLWAAGIMYQRLIKMGTGDLLAIPNAVTSGEARGLIGRIIKVLHVMTKKDTFVFITAIMAAAQIPLVAFGLIGFGSTAMAIGLTINEYRLRRREH